MAHMNYGLAGLETGTLPMSGSSSHPFFSLRRGGSLQSGRHSALIAPASHRDFVTRLQEMYNSLSR